MQINGVFALTDSAIPARPRRSYLFLLFVTAIINQQVKARESI
jgi:hypothetical protein